MNPDEQNRLECLRMAVNIIAQGPREDAPATAADTVLRIAARLLSFVRTGVVKEA